MHPCVNLGRNVFNRRDEPCNSAWDPRLLPRHVRPDPGEKYFQFILVLNDDEHNFPDPRRNDACLLCKDKVWHQCVKPHGKWWFLCMVRECSSCQPWQNPNAMNWFQNHERVRSITYMGIYHCQLTEPHTTYSLPRVDVKTFEGMLSTWPFHTKPVAAHNDKSPFHFPIEWLRRLIDVKGWHGSREDLTKPLTTTIQVFGPESQYEGDQLHDISVKNRVSRYTRKKESKMLKRCFRKWRRATPGVSIRKRRHTDWNPWSM